MLLSYLEEIINKKKMKHLFTLTLLFTSLLTFAQNVVNITYVTVPRENSQEFLSLHKKFTNLTLNQDTEGWNTGNVTTMSEKRKIMGSGIFSHAYAGDFTFAIYDFYDNASDIDEDANISNKVLAKNIEAMNLSKEEQAALTDEWRLYTKLYADNHSDQIRIFKGLDTLRYEKEGMDWKSRKVFVNHKFNTKWGKNQDFRNTWLAGYAKSLKESGTVEAMYASRHLYGSGMSWHMYVVHPDWKSLAEFRDNFSIGSMDENTKKFWESVSNHSDDIMIYIGGIDQETKKFDYVK